MTPNNTNNNSTLYTVSQLTDYLQQKFITDPSLQQITIIGEISNFNRHSSGHWYFSLKDEGAKISAVMFHRYTVNLNPQSFKEGAKVEATGSISIFKKGGYYSLQVTQLKLTGAGELYARFLAYKHQLEAKGYFSAKFKKPIPLFPKRIAIITAATGAAVHDIMNKLTDRWPLTEQYLFPALVQGENAAASIAAKINQIQTFSPSIDLIILGRGGGSFEDLNPFNEPLVAKAIFTSKIPIITGIGHETDYTIADFLADLRAKTPTDAAVCAVVDQTTILDQCQSFAEQLIHQVNRILTAKQDALNHLATSYCFTNSKQLYAPKILLVDHLTDQLDHATNKIYQQQNNKFKTYLQFWLKTIATYQHRLNQTEWQLSQQQDQLQQTITAKFQTNQQTIHQLNEQLQALNPNAILNRGYSITYQNQTIIKDASKVDLALPITTKLATGAITATVTKINKGEPHNGSK